MYREELANTTRKDKNLVAIRRTYQFFNSTCDIKAQGISMSDEEKLEKIVYCKNFESIAYHEFLDGIAEQVSNFVK